MSMVDGEWWIGGRCRSERVPGGWETLTGQENKRVRKGGQGFPRSRPENLTIHPKRKSHRTQGRSTSSGNRWVKEKQTQAIHCLGGRKSITTVKKKKKKERKKRMGRPPIPNSYNLQRTKPHLKEDQ